MVLSPRQHIVGCPVQLNTRLHLCRHTFASLWGDCLRFASLWGANSRGDSSLSFKRLVRSAICLRKAYIFQEFAEVKVYYRSVFYESSKAFNTLRKILLWIQPSYFSAWLVTVFGKCVRFLVHAPMRPGCFARRPLCHKVNLLSCVADSLFQALR